MDTKALRQKILDLAIRGKLVPQDSNDEPASVLLEKIRAEKEQMVRDGRLKKKDIKNDTIIFRGEDNLHYEKFQDGTVKCIEDEIPFELPEGWEWERLGNVSNIARGGSPRPIDAFLTDDEDGINWIKIGDTEKDGKYILQTKEKIKPSGLSKTRYVHSGDFLLTNSMSFGRPYILKTDGCIHDGWLVIGNINTVFNQDFLYYALSSGFMYSTLSLLAVGSTVKNLKSETVRSVLFPIPPINEQKRIAHRLEQLITFVEDINVEKSELIEIINMTKSKILDLAIRGKLVPQDPNDEPASVLLERIRAEKEELIKQGKIKRDKKESIIYKGEDKSYYEIIDGQAECIDDDIPFELPNNWEWARLSNIVQILNGDRGQNYPAKSKLQKSGIPFVSASNIDSGTVSSDELLCMTEEQYNALGAGKLIFGDIIYCIRGSLGKCGVFNMEKGAIASSLIIVRPIINDQIISKYIFNYLNSELSKSEITKYDNGSAQPNLAAKDFMKFLVPVPPIYEQNLINNTLQKINLHALQIESELL